MEPIGLIPACRAAVAHWTYQRRNYRGLRRWMAQGRVAFSAIPGQDVAVATGPWAFLPNLLRHWVGQGVDEVLLAPRSLVGLSDMERDPRFWTPEGSEMVVDVLHRRLFDPSTEPAGPQVDVRFASFSRYDEFHAAAGQVVLVDGWAEHLMTDLLPVLSAALARPWTATVTSDVPQVVPRGRRCTVSRQPSACGVKVHPHGLGLRFEHQD